MLLNTHFDDRLAQRSQHWLMGFALADAGSIPAHCMHLYWLYKLPWSERFRVSIEREEKGGVGRERERGGREGDRGRVR